MRPNRAKASINPYFGAGVGCLPPDAVDRFSSTAGWPRVATAAIPEICWSVSAD